MAAQQPTHQRFNETSYDSDYRNQGRQNRTQNNRQAADNRRTTLRRDTPPLSPGSPESIDQSFNRENYTSTGIRNVQVVRSTERKTRDIQRQSERARLRQLALELDEEEIKKLAYAEQAALKIRAQAQDPNGVFGTVQKTKARLRVVSVASTIAVWATPTYLFVILPLGLLATGLFGIAAGIYAIFGMTSDGVTIQSIWEFSGIGIAGQIASALIGVFFCISLLISFVNASMITVASGEFKIAFIKPWFGHGVALKLGCIILTLICSFLPLVQMAPVALLWVAAVFFYPK